MRQALPGLPVQGCMLGAGGEGRPAAWEYHGHGLQLPEQGRPCPRSFGFTMRLSEPG